MCCNSTWYETTRLRERMIPKGRTRFWKVYCLRGRGLGPVHFWKYSRIQAGQIISNRRVKRRGKDQSDYPGSFRWVAWKRRPKIEVNCGMHVFLTKKWAEEQCGHNQRIVPVMCDVADLVAADDTTAVFMKVTLSQRAYNKATRQRS